MLLCVHNRHRTIQQSGDSVELSTVMQLILVRMVQEQPAAHALMPRIILANICKKTRVAMVRPGTQVAMALPQPVVERKG
jgi:hypothetical protein